MDLLVFDPHPSEALESASSLILQPVYRRDNATRSALVYFATIPATTKLLDATMQQYRYDGSSSWVAAILRRKGDWPVKLERTCLLALDPAVPENARHCYWNITMLPSFNSYGSYSTLQRSVQLPYRGASQELQAQLVPLDGPRALLWQGDTATMSMLEVVTAGAGQLRLSTLHGCTCLPWSEAVEYFPNSAQYLANATTGCALLSDVFKNDPEINGTLLGVPPFLLSNSFCPVADSCLRAALSSQFSDPWFQARNRRWDICSYGPVSASTGGCLCDHEGCHQDGLFGGSTPICRVPDTSTCVYDTAVFESLEADPDVQGVYDTCKLGATGGGTVNMPALPAGSQQLWTSDYPSIIGEDVATAPVFGAFAFVPKGFNWSTSSDAPATGSEGWVIGHIAGGEMFWMLDVHRMYWTYGSLSLLPMDPIRGRSQPGLAFHDSVLYMYGGCMDPEVVDPNLSPGLLVLDLTEPPPQRAWVEYDVGMTEDERSLPFCSVQTVANPGRVRIMSIPAQLVLLQGSNLLLVPFYTPSIQGTASAGRRLTAADPLLSGDIDGYTLAGFSSADSGAAGDSSIASPVGVRHEPGQKDMASTAGVLHGRALQQVAGGVGPDAGSVGAGGLPYGLIWITCSEGASDGILVTSGTASVRMLGVANCSRGIVVERDEEDLSVLEMTDVVLENNQQSGVYVSGGAVRMTRVTFLSNGQYGYGQGALFVDSDACLVSMASCTFDGNQGPAMRLTSAYSRFSPARREVCGGGQVAVDSSLFTGGYGVESTAGILLPWFDYQVVVTNSLFQHNVAVTGGAIRAEANWVSRQSIPSLVISGCTFFNNTARVLRGSGGQGGAVHANGFIGASVVNITGSRFVNNSADIAGGAIWAQLGFLNYSDNSIATLAVTVQSVPVNPGDASELRQSLLVDGCSFEGNRAGRDVTDPFAGDITARRALLEMPDPYPRLMGMDAYPSMLAAGGTLLPSPHSSGSGRRLLADDERQLATVGGGGLFVSMGTVSILISGSTFMNEQSDGQGGAALVMGPAQNVVFQHTTFQSCQSRAEGGALSMVGDLYGTNVALHLNLTSAVSDVQLLNNTFWNNTASQSGGGGLYAEFSGQFTLLDCTFQENLANGTTGPGGGALLRSPSRTFFTFNNTGFVANNASGLGGGLACVDCGTLVVNSSFLLRNSASGGGGMWVNNAVEFSLINGLLVGNNATGETPGLIGGSCVAGTGGGLCLDGQVGSAEILATSLSLNEAEVGGGLFMGDVCAALSADADPTATATILPTVNDTRCVSFINTTFMDDSARSNISGEVHVTQLSNVNLTCAGVNLPTATAAGLLQCLVPNATLSDLSSGAARLEVVQTTVRTASFTNFTVTLRLVDSFGQTISNRFKEAFTQVSASRVQFLDDLFPTVSTSSNGSRSNNTRSRPVILGQDTVDMVDAVASFTSIQVLADPGQAYQMEFKTDQISLRTGANVTVLLRECQLGEQLVNRACRNCSEGTYTFRPDRDCRLCPDAALCNNGKIVPREHFWHSHPFSDTLHRCLIRDACRNRRGTSPRFLHLQEWHGNYSARPAINFTQSEVDVYMELQCNIGYEGRLCASCANGYGSRANRCVRCYSPTGARVLLSFLIAFQLFFVAYSIYSHMMALAGHNDPHGRQVPSSRPALGVPVKPPPESRSNSKPRGGGASFGRGAASAPPEAPYLLPSSGSAGGHSIGKPSGVLDSGKFVELTAQPPPHPAAGEFTDILAEQPKAAPGEGEEGASGVDGNASRGGAVRSWWQRRFGAPESRPLTTSPPGPVAEGKRYDAEELAALEQAQQRDEASQQAASAEPVRQGVPSAAPSSSGSDGPQDASATQHAHAAKWPKDDGVHGEVAPVHGADSTAKASKGGLDREESEEAEHELHGAQGLKSQGERTPRQVSITAQAAALNGPPQGQHESGQSAVEHAIAAANADQFEQITSIIKALVSYMQMLGTLAQLRVELNPHLSNFFTIVDASTPTAWTPLDCSFGGSNSQQALATVLITVLQPVAGIFFAVVFWSGAWLWYMRTPARLTGSNILDHLLHALVQIVFFYYESVTATTMSLFSWIDLDKDPYEDSRIVQPPDVVRTAVGSFWYENLQNQYNHGMHLALKWAVGVPYLIVFVLGMPMVAGYMLWRMGRDKQLKGDRTRLTWGFLYSDYRLDYCWWEMIITLRKFALIAIFVTLRGSSRALQVLLGEVVVVAALSAQYFVRPFRMSMANKLENYVLTTILITLMLLSFYASSEPESNVQILGLVLALLVNSLLLGYFAYRFYRVVNSQEFKEQLFLKVSLFKDNLGSHGPLRYFLSRKGSGAITAPGQAPETAPGQAPGQPSPPVSNRWGFGSRSSLTTQPSGPPSSRWGGRSRQQQPDTAAPPTASKEEQVDVEQPPSGRWDWVKKEETAPAVVPVGSLELRPQ